MRLIHPSWPIPSRSPLGVLILGDVYESNDSLPMGRPSKEGRSQYWSSLIGPMEAAHVPLAPGRQQEQTSVPIYLGNCLFFRQGEGEGSLKENIQPHAYEISAQNQSSFLIMRAVRALVQSEMMACVNIWSVTDLWVGEQKNKISR